jgi:hypothetical protein
MRSIYDEAISLINEPLSEKRSLPEGKSYIRESAREIARKRWGMEDRTGVAPQTELK